MIQGTFLDEIVDMFVEEYGVAKELIVPVNKLDKKKKNWFAKLNKTINLLIIIFYIIYNRQ